MTKPYKKYQELELNILNLGTEIYLLKNQVSQISQLQGHFIEILKGLKLLLDDKGVLNKEDFESAVEYCRSFEELELDKQNQIFDELEKLKKVSH